MLKLNPQTIAATGSTGGEPACVRVGRRVRIKRSDFDRLIEQGYPGRTPSSPPRATPDVWGASLHRMERGDFD